MDYEAYRQKLASSGQTGDQWQREADNWFDGSIESVDRRLAMCNLLLARSEAAVARETGSHKHLAALSDLRASQRHLQALRDDLLTASENKAAAQRRDKNDPIHVGSHADRRWVALEAARFHRAQNDIDKDELLIRAKHYAELQTSTRSSTDSKAITSAFVQRVASLVEEAPKRQVRVAAVRRDASPDEWMFM